MMVRSKSVDKKKSKVLVALSGGVDSAVAAALLKKQGYDVTGAHMVCWDEGPYCSADEDRASATKVAAHLNIPLLVFDFRKEYKEAVVDYFVSEYEAALTPNPDVACNKEIKFGIFFKEAVTLGFDYIATGHYSQIKKNAQSGFFELWPAQDTGKDQSYFLYNLSQKHLTRTLFPIGHLSKNEVREIARNLNLPNSERKDSQGICFIGDVQIKDFLNGRVKNRFGEIVNPKGRVIGKHEGLAYYTIGQREGLSISERIPHYVVDKQLKKNRLIVAPLGDAAAYTSQIKVSRLNWIGEKLTKNNLFQARIRYRQPLFKAKVFKSDSKNLILTSINSQRAVAPGQSVVFHSQTGNVLGGGVIV